MICFVWFRLFWSRVDWNQHVVDILFWRYMVVRSYSPWNCDFLSFFLHFYWTKKKPVILQLLSIFSKITLAFISGNSLFCIFLPCLLPPSPNYSFPCCFQLILTGISEVSSQIRQNSQVFHYSWFIAKWVHVLGKLSNMIQAFPTFCSGEKFPF